MDFQLYPQQMLRTVDVGAAVPHTVVAELNRLCSMRPEIYDYLDTVLGHTKYLTKHLRPLAELIVCCVPSSSLSPGELPEGRVEFLTPYVIKYIERAVRAGFFVSFVCF